MRVAFAGFHIESVSFLDREATVADFETDTTRGDAIASTFEGTNTVPGGVLAACRAAGIEAVPLVYAYQDALGPVSGEAVEKYLGEIREGLAGLAGRIDGAILHLHGAAAARDYPDVEGHFVRKLREAAGPDLPLVAAYDYHANLDAASVRGLNAAVAYRKSPHTDMGETGERAARWMARILSGTRTGVALARANVVLPSICSATALHPLSEIMADARRLHEETAGGVDVSVLAGFAYADCPNTGASVLVCGAKTEPELKAAAARFARTIWDQRKAILGAVPLHTPRDAVARARAHEGRSKKPVVLVEHADRMTDSTHLLAELIAQDARKAVLPFFRDAEAAQKAHAAGAGSEVDLSLGGWSSARAGAPLHVKARVLQSGPKRFTITGPMLTGQAVDLGLTAVVRIGGITVSLVSLPAHAVDEDCFRVFGQDLRDFDTVVLRSKTHFRAVFEALSDEILVVDTPDWGTADLKSLPYRRLDRSVTYPFADVPPAGG